MSGFAARLRWNAKAPRCRRRRTISLSALFECATRTREGWTARIGVATCALSPRSEQGTFGPSEAHSLDAALLENVRRHRCVRETKRWRSLGDSGGHEVSRRAEALCVSQFLRASTPPCSRWLRSRGVRRARVLTGLGHSAEFFSHVLQAPKRWRSRRARRRHGACAATRARHALSGARARGDDRERPAIWDIRCATSRIGRDGASSCPMATPTCLRAFVRSKGSRAKASGHRPLGLVLRRFSPHRARSAPARSATQRVGAGDAFGERHRPEGSAKQPL